MRNSVVLPHPDGPSSAVNSPPGKSSDTLSSATKFPKRFAILRTEILILLPSFLVLPRLADVAFSIRLSTSTPRSLKQATQAMKQQQRQRQSYIRYREFQHAAASYWLGLGH